MAGIVNDIKEMGIVDPDPTIFIQNLFFAALTKFHTNSKNIGVNLAAVKRKIFFYSRGKNGTHC